MLIHPACDPTIGTTSSPSEIRRSTALLLTPLKFVLPTGRTRSLANVGPTSNPSGSTPCPSRFNFFTAPANFFSAQGPGSTSTGLASEVAFAVPDDVSLGAMGAAAFAGASGAGDGLDPSEGLAPAKLAPFAAGVV